MTTSRLSIHLLLLLLFLATNTRSLPYFLITSNRPKCIIVTAMRETNIQIHYHAPDIAVMPDPSKMAIPPQVPPQFNVSDGMDAHFQRRQQILQMQEAMKRAGSGGQMRDITIVVRPSPKQNSHDQEWKRRRERAMEQQRRTEIVKRQELIVREGSFVYENAFGEVEICVQSMTASMKAPSRIMLNITEQQEKTEPINPIKVGADGKAVEMHVSQFQSDIMAMNRLADSMLSTAFYAKEQEEMFHEASIRLNSSSKYWPIIHITVLFLAGFTQANHIVRFFKERHIF